MGRLTSKDIERLTEPGRYPDGEGLYLQVTGPTSRSWIYRYQLNGKQRWLGLGSFPAISLSKARIKRDKARTSVRDRVDPVAEQKRKAEEARSEQRRAKTFREFAEEYLSDHAHAWKNAKHGSQWPATLTTYVYPHIGDVPVHEVNTEHVRQVLRPIWTAKPETANRVRGRIEAILSAAKAAELRDGDNPARWRGHLDQLFPRRKDVRPPKKHPALPYVAIGKFMADLREREGNGARALEFLILTAARTGEVIGARWSEIDETARAWTIPATRMKVNEEHRVPLSDAALAVLRQMHTQKTDDMVFPSGQGRRQLSNMAMAKVLERMGHATITVHGFRACFRTWAAEQTAFPSEVAEKALAHVVGNETHRAYQRGDLFERRRKLMEAWAEFCAKPARKSAAVIPIRA